MALLPRLIDRIRATGPMTVAAFMELALYDADEGYYATRGQRSGRDGDFYTSVDVGPLFGEFLAEFVARAQSVRLATAGDGPFDLVEAGAGNGRLTRDVLDALEREHPQCYERARVTLVERSAPARAAQAERLGPHESRLVASSAQLPPGLDGVLFANELLDAFPVHRVRMTQVGPVEVFVDADGETLVLVDGPLSTSRLDNVVAEIGGLPPGAIADVSLDAGDWMDTAMTRLSRGIALFIDYGYDAAELHAGHRLAGTLASYVRHQLDPLGTTHSDARPGWLEAPGTRDLTAHVDFSAMTRAATAAGARREYLLEQTALLLRLGAVQRLRPAVGHGLADVKRRLAAQALMTPLGLGGSHKALVLSKGLTGVAGLLDE